MLLTFVRRQTVFFFVLKKIIEAAISLSRFPSIFCDVREHVTQSTEHFLHGTERAGPHSRLCLI